MSTPIHFITCSPIEIACITMYAKGTIEAAKSSR
jgi:hypothetical protein